MGGSLCLRYLDAHLPENSVHLSGLRSDLCEHSYRMLAALGGCALTQARSSLQVKRNALSVQIALGARIYGMCEALVGAAFKVGESLDKGTVDA